MDLLRSSFDNLYSVIKPVVFSATNTDPEKAHSMFVSVLRTLYKMHLDGVVLNSSENSNPSTIALSNAAGFNKNGELPPGTLQKLGFERVVIGTVTYDSWGGNSRPRSVRFPETGSLVNWMGLPGIGAKAVADQLNDYRESSVPLTINLMSTPQKSGDEVLRDLEGTVYETRDLRNVDRFELNISCPNTHGSEGGMDARAEYQKQLGDMLRVVSGELRRGQQLYLKVSPDLDEEGVADILSVIADYKVAGFTATNTTTSHNPSFITTSPGKGGASGNAVYDASQRVQGMFADAINRDCLDAKLIACGGINSSKRVQERVDAGASEIQVYTPVIFSGTGYLRQLRRDFSE